MNKFLPTREFKKTEPKEILSTNKLGNAMPSTPKTAVVTTPTKPVYNYKSKPKLIISEEFLEKIKYLCTKISTVEWSGVLLYTIEGTMDNIKELVIHPKDILLMDIGSGAHTSFDYDPVVISEGYIDNPEWIDNEYRRGMIHSHNSMAVFYSGEDMSELHDNAHFYDFYLSVIVNNKLDIVGKIAFAGTIEKISETKTNYINSSREPKQLVVSEATTEEVLFTADCDIERINQSTPIMEYFDKRIAEIKAKQAIKTKGYGGYGSRYGEYKSTYPYNFNDSDDYEFATPISKASTYTPPKTNFVSASRELDIKAYIKTCFEGYDFGEPVYLTFDTLVDKADAEILQRIAVFADGNLTSDDIIEDFFDEVLSPGTGDYNNVIFTSYVKNVNKNADWSSNMSRVLFIDFLMEVIKFLEKYEPRNGVESLFTMELAGYFKDFVTIDKRLDHLKYNA